MHGGGPARAVPRTRLALRTCLAAAFASACLSSCRGPSQAGPLEPPAAEAPAQNYSGFKAEIGRPFTFGLIFVKNYGDREAVLEGVQLVEKTPGIELVGQLAADITDDHHTWSSDEKFPPAHPAHQLALSGMQIDPDAERCPETRRHDVVRHHNGAPVLVRLTLDVSCSVDP